MNIHLEANAQRHVLQGGESLCHALSNDYAESSKAFKAGLCEETVQFHLGLRIISQTLVVWLAAKRWYVARNMNCRLVSTWRLF